MKKIMMLLIVAVIMLGVAGNAMASFGEGDLIRVVYSTNNGTGTEYATDLGAFGNLTNASQITTPVKISANAFTPASVGGASDFSNMSVAYFIYDFTANNTNGRAWISGPANAGAANLTNYSTWQGGAYIASSLWGSTSQSTFTNAESNASSYYSNMNATGQGTMGGFATSSADKNLAALSTTGYVDQILYYYSDPATTGNRTEVAILRTSSDGSTTLMSAQATPIPAAIYLFGSGLMGLVGLRRKTAA